MTILRKAPCTIITGSLGSGKTTLLNHILQSQCYKRIAIIENELGEVGIDSTMVQSKDIFQVEEDTLQRTCGCLCRKVRGDLIRCLKVLKKRSYVETKPLDHILIETTGNADLAALTQTFFADEFVSEMCWLDGVLTLVDTTRLVKQLDEDRDHCVVENEAAKQLAYADMILLNRTDLVDKDALMHIKTRIGKINPSVPIRLASCDQIDTKDILGMDAWSLDKVLDSDEGFLDDRIHKVVTCDLQEGLVKCFNMAGEEVFASPVPREEAPFGQWLWRAAKDQIPKGRLHLVESNGDDIWVEPLQPFVNSVSIDIRGEVDKEKFDDWLSSFMSGNDENLFRYKGILALQGQSAPFVFQGMQTRTAWEFSNRSWLGDERRCKLHFMGYNLDREEFVCGFMQCLVEGIESEQPLAASLDTGTKCTCQ